jgi:SAM-dependent methyltransferase
MVTMAGATGHPPTVKIEPVKESLTEKQKYEKMWDIDDYRAVAPGEQTAMLFLEQAKPKKGSTCIDYGCGTGRGGLMTALMGGLEVRLVDFASNCLDEEVKTTINNHPDRLYFTEWDLTKRMPFTSMYGFCTDVMEHIPPEDVDKVLANILLSSQHVFFQICNTPDHMGQRIGHPLHLTVESYDWWLKKLRDQNCVIHWSHDEEGQYSFFYVTSWADMDDIDYDGKVNTEQDELLENVKTNIKGNWQRVHPHPIQSTEIMLICGGPSLNDFTDEIIELRAKGMPMVTTNGTYNWAIANGMKPSMQLMIDAREFNKRFVTPVIDDCKYMVASQCHPKVFENLPEDRTYLWHVGAQDAMTEVLDEHYDWWFPTPGGSTVTLRGLCLLRMLGFHKIHVYGFDSCYREDEHHAYEQPENDYAGMRLAIGCGGTRTFFCTPWMYTQAEEFIRMMGKFVDDELSLNIKGDGLIAHIIETGAALYALDKDKDEE